MSDLFFYGVLAVLIPALFAVVYVVAGQIAGEFKEGSQRVAMTMIAVVAVIVGTALPWHLL